MMKTLTIKRFYENMFETLGVIYLQDEEYNVLFMGVTLELPDKNNQKYISRIPEGEYTGMIEKQSGKFNYSHIWIRNVPNRSFIKIHRCNFHYDIQGCICVGEKFDYLNNDKQIDVVNSKKALSNLMDKLKNDQYVRIIIENV